MSVYSTQKTEKSPKPRRQKAARRLQAMEERLVSDHRLLPLPDAPVWKPMG
jgi:hypothetical protein